jgi:hypothetical protein
MKRFYCTVCKKVKRVQKFPADIQGEFNTLPEDRIGTCRRHFAVKPVKPVKVTATWTEANNVQAEGRFNRKAARKAAR